MSKKPQSKVATVQEAPAPAANVQVQVQVIHVPGRDTFFEECMKSLAGDNIIVKVDKFGPHLATRLDFIDRAVEDYVAFVDDDDLVVPGTIGKLLKMLSEADPETVVGAHSHEALISADGERLKTPVTYNAPFDLHTALGQFHFPRVSILRTDVAKEVSKFIRKQPASVQQYLYPEFTISAMAGLVGEWLELPEVGYLYRKHSGNSVNTIAHTWYRAATKKLLLAADAAFRATI